MNVEETLEEAVDVEPSGTESFDKEKADCFDLLRGYLQKAYCSPNLSVFQDIEEERKYFLGEDVTKSVNVVLGGPPCNTLGELNRTKYSYVQLSDTEMEAFAGVVKNSLARGGHSVELFSKYHFRQWYQLFAALK